MTTATQLITGTDFICVPTKDFDAAARFYGEVLGLPKSKRWGSMPAAEFETPTRTATPWRSTIATRRQGRSRPRPLRLTYAAFEYRSEPGVVRSSPVSSSVLRPERIIGQPP